MLSPQQVEKFHQEGFVTMPKALPPEAVREVRQVIADVFASRPDAEVGDVAGVRQNMIVRNAKLAEMVLSGPVLATLKSLLGEKFVILPETSVMDSQFGDWHTDMTTAELIGYDLRRNKDFFLLNAGFYFQDNGKYGGGLDVVPGSHLKPDQFLEKVKTANEAFRKPSMTAKLKKGLHALTPDFLLKARRKAMGAKPLPLKGQSTQPGQLTVAQQAGDMLMFDLRLSHKASWPEVPPPFPPESRKLAYFVICGADNETTRKYKDFLVSRSKTDAAYRYLRNHSYPEALRKKAEAVGVTLL